MAYLNVDGDRRVYYEHYTGTARPIVLIHGWGATCRAWETVLPPLFAAGHEVVTLDVRAAGKSDMDFDEVTIDATANDVLAIIEATGLDRPVINGWSAGGGIAAEVAIRLGSRSGGLVLTCGASPRYTQAPDWPYGGTAADIEGTVAAIRANRADGFFGVASAVCSPESNVSSQVVQGMWLQFLESGVRHDDLLIDLAKIDQRDGLRNLPVPALVFAGGKDLFVSPEAAKAAADLIPDATFVSCETSGHAPFIEQPELYRDELLGFLKRVG